MKPLQLQQHNLVKHYSSTHLNAYMYGKHDKAYSMGMLHIAILGYMTHILIPANSLVGKLTGVYGVP